MARGRQEKKTDALLMQLLRKKRLQILTLDERWHRLFTEEDKTERLKKLEAEVNKLLKRQGQVNTDLKDVKKVKARLMQNIMDNMEGTMGESERTREKRLDKSQKLIREANEKIAQLELQAEEVPERLEESNRELLEESVSLCYERIDRNKEEIDELAEWIEETRTELKRRLVRKQEIEDENSMIYSNLHDMLGPELLEYFDAEYGEDGEA
ncbi:MAG: hypothetical protein J6B06_05740 [Lachnospiraceae bacterium]|nr:hypothetical protein [Lachnospiraceae bacterium]